MDLAAHPELMLAILAAGALAGWVDSIAGGGGLIALPTLLLVGLDPLAALGTNKLQGTAGTLMAAANYARRGLLVRRRLGWLIAGSFLGAAAGTALVQQMDPGRVAAAIPVLLVAVAVYFLLSPRVSDLDSRPRLGRRAYAASVAPAIGFYDGFFGPGTGSFFTLTSVSLLGGGIVQAVALTKVLNLTSNVASLGLFLAGSHVVWLAGGLMVAGQLVGSWLGSHMAMRSGARLIRPLMVAVCIAMALRLLYERLG